MGRKSTKAAKERKLRRLEENARLSAAQKKVDEANKDGLWTKLDDGNDRSLDLYQASIGLLIKQLEDPMELLQPFKKFERNGVLLAIQCYRAGDMDTELKEFVFGLCKENMQKLYEDSEWGWKDREKRDEMLEDKAWYLIVRDEKQAPVAFVHFRFDIEIDEEVLYCYEIQLTKEVRRKGLGKFLMQILELMAFKTEMVKVMLTTFRHNDAAKKFFMEALKYQIDESSPGEFVYEQECTYHILSKAIKPKTQPPKKTVDSCCASKCKVTACDS